MFNPGAGVERVGLQSGKMGEVGGRFLWTQMQSPRGFSGHPTTRAY